MKKLSRGAASVMGAVMTLASLVVSCKSTTSASESPDIGADEPAPLAVCAHMDAVRSKKTPGIERDETCLRRVTSYALLDGRTLWMLRGRCILESKSTDDYMLCNAAGHPEWPRARARVTEEQLAQRLRALEPTLGGDAAR